MQAFVLEHRALLNVELQVQTDVVAASDRLVPAADGCDGLGKCAAFTLQRQHIDRQGAGKRAAADGRDAEVGWLLGQKVDDFQGVA